MNTTATKKQRATYWAYTGNHPEGHDCSRHNKHGYPMGLVAYVSYQFGDSRPDVKVNGFGKTQFGSTIQVDAPEDVWLKAWIDWAERIGHDYRADIDEIREDGDGLWAVIKGYEEEDRFFQVFHSDNETKLEMVQKGYVPIGTYKGQDVYIFDEDVAKV